LYFFGKEIKSAKQIFEGIWARPFWGDDIMLVVVDLESFAVLPSHNHYHEQAGIVLEGELEFTIAGETRLLRQGDLYFIPSNIEHCVKVNSCPAKVLDVFHPVREDFK
jgi:quercetin dioxygenase-like cupin family protein